MALKRWAVALIGLLHEIAPVNADAGQSITRSTIFTRAQEIQTQYDYIVVGGGTAGLTVADRLTENGKREWLRRIKWTNQI